MNNNTQKNNKKSKLILILVFVLVIGGAVFAIYNLYQLNQLRAMTVEGNNNANTETNTKEIVETQESVESVDNKKIEKSQETLELSQSSDSMMTIYNIEDGYIRVPYIPELGHHDYDWNLVTEENGYKYYEDDNHERSNLGIDVSKYQGDIDWRLVKESGIEFVIIRLGFRGYGSGELVIDEYFHQNVVGALKVGIDVGVYFFSQAINQEEAYEEAEFVYNNIKDYNITYPVIFDTEEIKNDEARTDGLDINELTDITITFCERIKELDFDIMIYANSKWLTTSLDLTRLEDYDIWYADYQEEPLYPYQFEMWQYSEEGIVPGIEGYVDLNIKFN